MWKEGAISNEKKEARGAHYFRSGRRDDQRYSCNVYQETYASDIIHRNDVLTNLDMRWKHVRAHFKNNIHALVIFQHKG